MKNKYVLIIENHLIHSGTFTECVEIGSNIQKIGKCDVLILSIEFIDDEGVQVTELE